MNLTGAPNFRDLGGYSTADGRIVKNGRVFRSDHLGHLEPADLQHIAERVGQQVRVLDLRGVTEREHAACAIPNAIVHSLAIEPTIVQKLQDLLEAGADLTAPDVEALMHDTYRGFVRGNTPQFAKLFGHLLDAHDAPVVFHCTAGKDRTGFAAALLLHALGVSDELIMRDYLLTNERLAGRLHPGLFPPVVGKVLWGVQEDFLHAAFEAVQEDFGDLDNYLRDGIGLREAERHTLHAMYLQPAAR